MFFASYDRRNQPNYAKMMAVSVAASTVSTALSHPFEFLKTKIQIYNEGIGITGKRLDMGYNMYHVFKKF